MEQRVFKPRYTIVLWAFVLLYAAPWLFSLPNAAFGKSSADWKLFWLLSGTVWILAGLLHMRGVLLKKIILDKEITVEMYLQEPASQSFRHAVRIRGDLALFRGQAVQMQYLSNAAQLMQAFVSRAGAGRMDLVYEEGAGRGGAWTKEKNLLCLIVFALYMMAMLALRLRPLRLVGPATDAFLFGWALMLPVLLAVKVVNVVRDRTRIRENEAAKWM
jgi:hypothetical protein